VPTCLVTRKAISEGPTATVPANPPGSKTVARAHGRGGNSGGPLGSSREGGRMVQPAHWQASQRSRGSRMPSYERRSGVTPAEQRRAQPAARLMATSATRRGGTTTTTGVERIAQRARSQPEAPFTALMHHFTVDNLRACFAALDGTKAPGVDGVTKERHAQHFDIHLQALEDVSNLWICYPLGIRKNYQSEWGTR
jgi:hypothetical protein